MSRYADTRFSIVDIAYICILHNTERYVELDLSKLAKLFSWVYIWLAILNCLWLLSWPFEFVFHREPRQRVYKQECYQKQQMLSKVWEYSWKANLEFENGEYLHWKLDYKLLIHSRNVILSDLCPQSKLYFRAGWVLLVAEDMLL